MVRDYFAILGLVPGRYAPAEITRRFESERQRLLTALHEPAQYVRSRQQLEELHVAYLVLRDPRAQADYLQTRGTEEDAAQKPAGAAQPEREQRAAHLRQLIAAALEDGLLRYSRRQMILEEGRRLGFSDFHTQLLIAQVQFSDEPAPPPVSTNTSFPHEPSRQPSPRAWARWTAAGMLGAALFLAMMRWLGG